MTVVEATTLLTALGWRSDGRSFTSPSEEFGFEIETLETDIARVYAPAARRVHSPLDMPPGVREELRELMKVLERDPLVQAIALQLRGVQAVLFDWAPRHGMTLSLWDFSYPAVRATARHPAGGVASIECIVDGSANVETLVHHWIDDRASSTRRSWSVGFRGQGQEAEVLLRLLDEALHLLLAADPSTYATSDLDLPSHAGLEADEAYWAAFQILH